MPFFNFIMFKFFETGGSSLWGRRRGGGGGGVGWGVRLLSTKNTVTPTYILDLLRYWQTAALAVFVCAHPYQTILRLFRFWRDADTITKKSISQNIETSISRYLIGYRYLFRDIGAFVRYDIQRSCYSSSAYRSCLCPTLSNNSKAAAFSERDPNTSVFFFSPKSQNLQTSISPYLATRGMYIVIYFENSMGRYFQIR